MKLAIFISAVALALSCSSCNNPAAPEDPDSCLWDLSVYRTVSVTVDVDKELSFFTDIRLDEEQPAGTNSQKDNAPALRYIVKAFRHGSTQQVASASGLNPTLEISLPVGKIDLIAWVDYVDPSLCKDKYFFTDDFNEMLVMSKYPYYANDRHKICYRGKKSVIMAYNTRSLTVDVAPAMGQLRIIAVDEFRSDVKNIQISYPAGVPSAINAFSGEISYVWNDVFFNTTPQKLDNGDWLLAVDNIFTGEKQISVPFRINMTDADGETVARRLKIEAPMKRGGITEVRGKFFSILEDLPPAPPGPGSGGLVIDPNLNDTIIYYL